MRKMVLGVVGAAVLVVPAAASAAPATFAGSCSFNGTMTPSANGLLTMDQMKLRGSQGSCDGRLVRADGVTVTQSLPARLDLSATYPMQCAGGVGAVSYPGAVGGPGTITFVGAYPSSDPAIPPLNEALNVQIDAMAFTDTTLETLLTGGGGSTYPAGTHAQLDASYAVASAGCSAPRSFSATLTTGPSPTSAGAVSDELIGL